jgi:hypothetical protein
VIDHDRNVARAGRGDDVLRGEGAQRARDGEGGGGVDADARVRMRAAHERHVTGAGQTEIREKRGLSAQ